MKTPQFPLAPDRFGVTEGTMFQKWQAYPTAFRRARIDDDVRLMRDAGVRWVRVGFPLTTPLPSEAPYYLDALQSCKIRVVGRFAFSTWPAPADRFAFRKRVEDYVRAYPDITVWEAGNEPNLTSSWKSAPEDYAPALQAVYETVKSVDTKRQVASAGFSEWKLEPFLQLLAKQNAHRWMDIFAVHPYAPNPQKVTARLNAIKNALRDTGMETKPVWITEIGFYVADGWKNVPGHVAYETTKADYLEQTFALLAPATDGPVFWYTFQEQFKGKTLGFGLLNWDDSASKTDPNVAPRALFSPAYTRYKQLSGGQTVRPSA